MLGTESPGHNFRFGCLALSLHEDKESYAFTFKTLKQCLQEKFSFNFSPQFSLSDAHKGQIAAIKEVFPDTIKLRCTFHLMQNVQTKVQKYKQSKNLQYVYWVTKVLHEAPSSQELEEIWKLLKPELLKMTENEEFVKSYETDFVNSESLWYQGASFIGKQKNQQFFRGHKPISQR